MKSARFSEEQIVPHGVPRPGFPVRLRDGAGIFLNSPVPPFLCGSIESVCQSKVTQSLGAHLLL
jgi:hypothetical protein